MSIRALSSNSSNSRSASRTYSSSSNSDKPKLKVQKVRLIKAMYHARMHIMTAYNSRLIKDRHRVVSVCVDATLRIVRWITSQMLANSVMGSKSGMETSVKANEMRLCRVSNLTMPTNKCIIRT